MNTQQMNAILLAAAFQHWPSVTPGKTTIEEAAESRTNIYVLPGGQMVDVKLKEVPVWLGAGLGFLPVEMGYVAQVDTLLVADLERNYGVINFSLPAGKPYEGSAPE